MTTVPNFTRFTSTSGAFTEIAKKIDLIEKGAPNGVCPLGANGLISPEYYDPNVMQFLGTWDAMINNPSLVDGGINDVGDMFIVSVGGDQFIPTVSFSSGDFVIYDGTKWKRVPTNLDTKISTITNSDGTISIDVTDPVNPVVNNQIDFKRRTGSYKPLDYFFQSPTTNGGQIGANASVIASITQITIGTLPINRGLEDADYIAALLEKHKAQLPFKLRWIDTTNTASYATFNINTYAGAGANNQIFNVSIVAGETTMVNTVPNGTRIFVYFDFFIPRQAGQITTNNTGSYITPSDVQSNLNAIDGVIGTHVSSTTAHTATNIVATSVGQTRLTSTTVQGQLLQTDTAFKLQDKNTLENSSVQLLNATSLNPSNTTESFTLTANGSLDIVVTGGSSFQFNRAIFINLPHKKLSLRNIAPRRLFFAVQLLGTGWTSTNGFNSMLLGFTNEATMENTSWMTTDAIVAETGVWGTKEKVIRAKFNGVGVDFLYGGTAVLGTRTGYITNAASVPTDVILFYQETNTNFSIEIRRSSNGYANVWTKGTIAHPDGNLLKSNFNQSPLIPVVSNHAQSSEHTFRIMSKRDTDLLGITITDGENAFH